MEPNERLRLARERAGYQSPLDAARAFGWNENTYKSHEGGIRGIRPIAAKRYAKAFRVSTAWILTGEETGNLSKPQLPVDTLPVLGDVAAGVWVEQNGYDEPHEFVPVVADSRFSGMKQFALKVRGESMNVLIRDGEFVICVDAIDLGRAPRKDDIVVVTRTRSAGHLRETTLKQVEVNRGKVELWPRSTDKKYQLPLILNDGDEDGVDVEITAYVIAVHRPML